MTLSPLKTPSEMYAFTADHGYGSGFDKGWGVRNFQWIVRHLESGEQVFFTFVGLHRFRSMSSHQRNFVYAISNRRVLMGQVRIFGLTRFESIPLDQLQSISINHENSIGVTTLIFDNDTVGVGMAPETAQNLGSGLAEILPALQEMAQQLAADSAEDDE